MSLFQWQQKQTQNANLLTNYHLLILHINMHFAVYSSKTKTIQVMTCKKLCSKQWNHNSMYLCFACVKMCDLRLVDCANFLVQPSNGHTYGLSPVCMRTCVRRLKSSENRLPQPSNVHWTPKNKHKNQLSAINSSHNQATLQTPSIKHHATIF